MLLPKTRIPNSAWLVFFTAILLLNLTAQEHTAPKETAEAEVLLIKAMEMKKQGLQDSLLFYYKKSILAFRTNGSFLKALTVQNDLGLFLRRKGNFDTAQQQLLEATKLGRETLGEEHIQVARSYYLLGSVYRKQSNYDASLSYQFQALELRKKILGTEHADVGRSLNALGSTYYDLRNYDAARNYYQRALDVKRKALGENHRSVVVTLHNIANIEYQSKNFLEAIQAYKNAVSIEKGIENTDPADIALTYNNIAAIYAALGNYSLAEAYYDSILAVQRPRLGDHHPDIAGTFHNIGEMHVRAKNFDAALSNYEQALKANLVNPDTTVPFFGIENTDILSRDYMLKTLHATALTLRKKAVLLNNDAALLQEALEIYKLLTRLIDTMRQSFDEESTKLVLAARAYGIYDGGIETALQLHRMTADKDMSFLSDAFTFSEHGKARVLQDDLTLRRNRAVANNETANAILEKQFRDSLSFYDTQLMLMDYQSRPSINTERNAIRQRLFKLRVAYQDYIRDQTLLLPTHASDRQSARIYHPLEIADLLQEDAAFLSFYIGSDSLYTFLLRNKSVEVISATLPDSHWVQAFTEAIFNGDHEDYINASAKLYSSLLATVLPRTSAKRLIISPHQQLHYLSFEALRKDSKSPFLIEQYEVEYCLSGNWFAQSTQRLSSKKVEEFIGFAPVFNSGNGIIHKSASHITVTDKDNVFAAIRRSLFLNDSTLIPLEATQQEVEEIGKIVQATGIAVRTNLHGEATEHLFKSLQNDKNRIIHIATHAFANERNPQLSGIFFSMNDRLQNEDGVLYARELYSLALDARLVVLSACETGRGHISQGEGLLGLGRGFLHAGTQQLLVSLWEVADIATADIMIHFYRELLKGQPYASALRTAKLAMIKSKTYSEPFFWAPFILIGQEARQ